MKKNKEDFNDDESVEDPDNEESEDAFASFRLKRLKSATEEFANKKRSHGEAEKREHSEEKDEEDYLEDEEDSNEEEDEEEDDSDSDSAKKPKKRRTTKHEEEEEDSDDNDNNFNDTSGIPPKDYTSGAFVVAKTDVGGTTEPTLWRIDGKALLQKYLPYKEDGKVLYKSTSTYSGWNVTNKEKYLAAQVTFKVQNRNQTIVELHLDPQQISEAGKVDKED